MLTRRDFVRRVAGAGLLATPAAAWVAAPGCGARTQRPNIVMILVDDQAHDALGFSGRFPFLATPHIDRLAAQSLRFRNAFVTTALCSPSRASFLTGCYASIHGVLDNEIPKAADFQFGRLPTLPDVLRASGYDTAYIGKWHLGSGAPFRAFDYWAGLPWQGSYTANHLNVNGSPVLESGYVTDVLTEYAVRWLREEASYAPFFLMLSHKAVHKPFQPAERHRDRFPNAALPMPANYLDDLATKHAFVRRRAMYKSRAERRELGDAEVPSRVPPPPWNSRDRNQLNYLRCILSVDDSVGSVLDALDETGRAGDTLVIFSSDQGYFLGEHQLAGKNLMYEAALRIPLLARPPAGGGAPRDVEEMVLNIDLAPSVLDLADCETPASMQGESFAGLLRGGKIAATWRDSFFYEHVGMKHLPMIHGLRTQRWKLITYPGEDFEELYDLETDPLELTNLARDPASSGTLAELRAQLAERRDAALKPATS